MKPSDIEVRAPFSTLFPIDRETLEAIAADMRTNGYDAAQPIVLWRNSVVDGHTRLEAAMLAGVPDVPVVEREFADEDEALQYAIHTQRDRRNLTDADIVRLVGELDKRRTRAAGQTRDENGRLQPKAPSEAIGKSAVATAEIIGTSRQKVEKARAVLDKATPEVKAAVMAGERSINSAYQETRKDAKEKKEPVVKHKIGPPCDGMQFARLAIMDLEKIRSDDTERRQAFATVKEWINEHK